MSLRAEVVMQRDQFVLDMTLAAEPGETVAVVGPNGAGKTTLLRLLAGLEQPTSGSIAMGGQTWVDRNRWVGPQDRRVGMVFADGALFPHLSSVANVAFGLEARGTRRGEAAATAARWLDRLGVGELGARLPRELSSGQAQRVALARALVVEPSLLLLDEPLASLDAASRTEVRRDLRSHLQEFGGVTVLVSHDPIDARLLADRLVVVEDGRVTNDGTPAEVTSRPRSPYAARLVGVNLFEGVATGGRVRVATGLTLQTAGDADGPVLVALHPTAVALHASTPSGTPRNVWETVVAEVDTAGPVTRVTLTGPVELVAEVTTGAAIELGLAPGGRTWVAIKATELDVYPA
ncbi:MAG: sulfate/molybdate ABC transporter ATP-binding protein [Acidimicrobiales bacterium]